MYWQLRDRRLEIRTRPLIMGVINVTPDSFSDAGLYATADRAVARGIEMAEQGADLLDIGGESTRPGAEPVPAEVELQRVRPVIAELARRTLTPLSVDTSKAQVARACLDSGAAVINDVTALTGDPDMIRVAQASGAGLVLMHMQGTPQTMQDNPTYGEVVGEIKEYLRGRVQAVTAAGIDAERVAVDPGIGFGKTLGHNLEILRRLGEFQELGRPLCLGVSRKGFIGRVLDRTVQERESGSLAVLCHALCHQAVQIIRVHDVAATRDAVKMWEALCSND